MSQKMRRGAKAIAQFHNGIKYRSRTEARWAAYFDDCGIAFEYEPEGYDLDGEYYVPDFLLRYSGVFFEVKGERPNERERRVATALAFVTLKPVVIASGNPRHDVELSAVFPPVGWKRAELSHDNGSSGVWLGVPQYGEESGSKYLNYRLTPNCTSRGWGADHRLDDAGKMQFRAPDVSGQIRSDWKNRNYASLSGDARIVTSKRVEPRTVVSSRELRQVISRKGWN